MEELLDLVDNVAHVSLGTVGVESPAGSSFDNWLLMFCADSRLDVRTEQRHDVILIRRGHRAGCLSSLAGWYTRFTGPEALLQD